MRRDTIIPGVAVLLTAAVLNAQAPAPPSSAAISIVDYNRALGLQAKYTGKTLNLPDSPVFLPSGKLWYRKTVAGGFAFVLVDPAVPSKAPAFDHARLAAALSSAMAKPVTATTLPFTAFGLSDDGRSLTFAAEGAGWACSLADYRCEKGGPVAVSGRGQGAAGAGAGPGRGGSGTAATGGAATSPDGKFVARLVGPNIEVSAADGQAPVARTQRGTAEFPYALGQMVWSPDSKQIALTRTIKSADRRMVRYVDSSPADQVQPKTFERFYAKPGDELEKQERVMLNVAANTETVVDPALYPNAYQLSRTSWWKDSRGFTFEYNQRGHQLYRVVEMNVGTGAARTLIDEPTDTFIHYARATGGLTDGGRTYRFDVNDGKEIIWMSERDGWAHLYLYDGITGRVKNQITTGKWMVRGVVQVDESARQITFTSGGMDPKQDPYFTQYYRVNFDGSGLTALTTADGYHTAVFSPDQKFFVDTWSRVDVAPVLQLKRVSDGSVVLDLEKADLAPLTAAGWRAPEAFSAKGRDGVTDIYGIIIRPTQFDPARRYPVIENIYAGPHGSFVPKQFTEYFGMQALADLGFVVVQIDGMGTANRSKAFHDVAFKNLKDAGFPDRILWHKAVARKYPYYDISRVGIYGGSAGGQNALGGMLFHGDFYKAAVAFAGCHDNRMDKIWWNEQWMSWPIGPQYAESSNVVNASRLQGKLMLVVGELDTNVDPASTFQVANALIKANKQFDFLMMPGEDHPAGRRGPSAPYGDRKLWDFFVTNLLDAKTPNWNAVPAAASKNGSVAAAGEASMLFGQSWTEIAAGWVR